MNHIIVFILGAVLGLGQFHTSRVAVFYDREPVRAASVLASEAERFLDVMEEKFGISFDEKIDIYFAGSNQEFKLFQPDGNRVPIWADGIAYPKRNIIVLKSARADPNTDVNRVLAHEITHLVLGHLFQKESIPRWLNEGLTMHIADDWGPGRQWAMVRAVGANRLVSLNELVYSFPIGTFDAQTAYAESYYFVAFIRDRYGVSAINRLIGHLGHGVSAGHAFAEITGQNMDELEETFDQWLRRRFSIFWIITNPGMLWALAAILLIIALIRRRRAAIRKMAEWEAEENEPASDFNGPGGSGPFTRFDGTLRDPFGQRPGSPVRALPPEGRGDDSD